jgi:hypothetical protein
MNDSYTSAMFARVDPPVLLDEEVVSAEDWPSPAPFVWSPRPSLWERFWIWLKGVDPV